MKKLSELLLIPIIIVLITAAVMAIGSYYVDGRVDDAVNEAKFTALDKVIKHNIEDIANVKKECVLLSFDVDSSWISHNTDHELIKVQLHELLGAVTTLTFVVKKHNKAMKKDYEELKAGYMFSDIKKEPKSYKINYEYWPTANVPEESYTFSDYEMK